jgi:hypothetical protein
MTYTPQQLAAIRAVGRAITDVVRAAGERGAPAGVVQSKLVAAGCAYAQYHQFIGALIRAGRVERRGNLLFAPAYP